MKHYNNTQLLLIMPRTYLTLSLPHYLHAPFYTPPPPPSCLSFCLCLFCLCLAMSHHTVGWVLFYVHRNRRLSRDGSPGRPPRPSHSSWALNNPFLFFYFVSFLPHCRSISVNTSRVIIKCDSTTNKFRFRIQRHERLTMDRYCPM